MCKATYMSFKLFNCMVLYLYKEMSDVGNIRMNRIGSILAEEISKIISTEVHDEDISFVTINAVKVSSDLSYAKVYFTTLDDSKRESTLKALNHASGFIRSKLCEVVDLRKMPLITFVYDTSYEYGKKIEDIIDKINYE